MTHEPECYLRDYELSSCRQCDDLRHAYERGRENIIETVAQVMDDTPPHRRSLGVQDLMNRIEEALKDPDDDDE